MAFALILRRHLPEDDHPIAALFGVAGTMLIRVILIVVVSGIIELVGWILFPIGGLLVYGAIRMVRGEEPLEQPESWGRRQFDRPARSSPTWGSGSERPRADNAVRTISPRS